MLTVLKEMQKSLQEDDGFNNRQNIARDLLGMGLGDGIVQVYQICSDIAELAQENQLTSIHNKIAAITDFNVDYFWENGYANYEDLTAGRLECLLYDAIKEMEE